MRLFIDGVELQFGLAAALGVLVARGVSPFEGAAAWFKIEGEQDDLTDEENRAADAWREAEAAALLVCCGEGAREARADLDLVTGPEGELWVGKRPSGRWAWEALLVDEGPDSRIKRLAGEAESEAAARVVGGQPLAVLVAGV